MTASQSPSTAILKAIDDEHQDMLRAAQAIYAERMKPGRAKLEAVRRETRKAMKDASDAFEAERKIHDAEHMANMEEANRVRIEMREAVLGTRPARISGGPTVTVRPRGEGKPVTMPRFSCSSERLS